METMLSNVPVMIRWVICMSIPVLIANVIPVYADEPIPIRKILENPQNYNLYTVTLKGRVQNLKIIPGPYFSEGSICFGAYTFTLKDKTGSLQAVVGGVCDRGEVKAAPEVSDGETILLEAVIQGPGYYVGPGLPTFGENRTTTQAFPTKIWHKEK